MKIGIDWGHGGRNTGCTAPGIVERDYVEAMGEVLHCHLVAHGFSPVETRGVGTNPPFWLRGLRTHGCDCVVCLHVNANGNPLQNGLELYHMPTVRGDNDLCQEIARRCPAELLPREGGHVRRPRIFSAVSPKTKAQRWLQRPRNVLRWHRPPTALLEVGYATHVGNREFLLSKNGMDSIAVGVVKGIETWMTIRHP